MRPRGWRCREHSRSKLCLCHRPLPRSDVGRRVKYLEFGIGRERRGRDSATGNGFGGVPDDLVGGEARPGTQRTARVRCPEADRSLRVALSLARLPSSCRARPSDVQHGRSDEQYAESSCAGRSGVRTEWMLEVKVESMSSKHLHPCGGVRVGPSIYSTQQQLAVRFFENVRTASSEYRRICQIEIRRCRLKFARLAATAALSDMERRTYTVAAASAVQQRHPCLALPLPLSTAGPCVGPE